MHDFWNYNLNGIGTRANIVGRVRLRINIDMYLSGKGNLIVEWRPSGMRDGFVTLECDWIRWKAYNTDASLSILVRRTNFCLFIIYSMRDNTSPACLILSCIRRTL
jgi:hypothetical protein